MKVTDLLPHTNRLHWMILYLCWTFIVCECRCSHTMLIYASRPFMCVRKWICVSCLELSSFLFHSYKSQCKPTFTTVRASTTWLWFFIVLCPVQPEHCFTLQGFWGDHLRSSFSCNILSLCLFLSLRVFPFLPIFPLSPRAFRMFFIKANSWHAYL